MTPSQAYKYGFLLRCAEEGLTPAQTTARARVCKQAVDPWSLVLAPVAAAAGVGLLGGAASSRLMDPTFDVKDLQRRELAGLYASFADDLEAKNRSDLSDPAEEA